MSEISHSVVDKCCQVPPSLSFVPLRKSNSAWCKLVIHKFILWSSSHFCHMKLRALWLHQSDMILTEDRAGYQTLTGGCWGQGSRWLSYFPCFKLNSRLCNLRHIHHMVEGFGTGKLLMSSGPGSRGRREEPGREKHLPGSCPVTLLPRSDPTP